jgi:hypothetical protein
MFRRPPRAHCLPFVCAPLLLLAAAGCGSSSPPSGPVGGALTGPADDHCVVNGVMTVQPVSFCMLPGTHDATDGGADDAGPADAAVTVDAVEREAGSGGSDFGPTMYNSEGDDDDCKYHVVWSSTPVRKNADVTFTVTATRLADAQPATGADVQLEAFFPPTHPTPTINIPHREDPPGTYTVGPLRLDVSGDWTVRFHFYEMCLDAPQDSPHGHAAFFVHVP